MLIRDILDKTLANETKIRILRLLFKYGAERTGRQLAKEVGASPTTAGKFLSELVNDGIINVKGAGKSHLYSVNDKNYVVRNLLRPFFEKEKNIFGDMISLIKKSLAKTGTAIESAAIFGSVAEKKETARSDIDLMIIIRELKDRKKMEAAVDKISIRLAKDFQTVISPYILSTAQFKKRYSEKSPIINEILKTHILIMGSSLERMAL